MSQKGILVAGSGGHAKVCIEILQSSGFQVDFCIGDKTVLPNTTCLNIPVLAGDESLYGLWDKEYREIFIAIGSTFVREKVVSFARRIGFAFVNAISPAAYISPSAVLGKGIAVMPGAVINAEAHIGDFAIINTGSTIDHDCIIGENAHIAPQCGIAGCVTVGNNTFLGVGCKVIPGINIGESCIIGAGSVVIRNIENSVKAYGVPAIPNK